MLKWYEKTGNYEDVVIETRIRLARNINGFRFADRMSKEEAGLLVNSVLNTFEKEYPDACEAIRMEDCKDTTKRAMKELQQISSHLVNHSKGAVLLSPDEGTAVMVNAEDHIRIQVIANGMNMGSCFKQANDMDDFIDAHFEYAFDEKLGYKTTFPTNVGTGLRASYTLHLPALADAKRLQPISGELARFGFKFRRLYGDEDGNWGHIYQIASQRSLGQTERDIIRDLDNIVLQIVKEEKEQRKTYYDNDHVQIEDEIFKSYGVLRYARKLSLKESLVLLSELKLGEALGILKFEDQKSICMNKLLMEIQPAVILDRAKQNLSVAECDIRRAEYLRKSIPMLL